MRSILSILFLLTISLQAQNGIVRSYYANHKIQARLSYVKDVLDAKSIWYYDNGNLKTIKTYDLGKLNGKVTEFHRSGLVKEDYSVTNGIRNGIDKIYWENGALKEIRYYEMGKLVKRVTIENDPLFVPQISDYKGIVSNKRRTPEKEISICDVEICPSPIGGIKAIQGRVIYPKEAKQYGLEGEVSIVATIDKKGVVTAAEVIKGIGLGCDEAAIKAVKESGFLPGLNKGKIVKSHLTINIEFKIKNKLLSAAEKDKHIETSSEPVDFEKILPKIIIEDSTDNVITQTQQPKRKTVQNETQYSSAENKKNGTENKDYLVKTGMFKRQHINTESKIKIITCNLETCPEPVGGITALLKRFKIPRKAYQLKLNGEIIIKAKIDKWGNVLDTKVIKGVGYGVGTAAEVAVLFTKFKPGMDNGEPVKASVTIVLPVKTTAK